MNINIDGEVFEADKFSTKWPVRFYRGDQLCLRVGPTSQIEVKMDADISVDDGYVLKRQGYVVGVLIIGEVCTK